MAVLDYAGLSYFKNKLINNLYPVGTVIQTSSATAPTIGGTWVEVIASVEPLKWGQLRGGTWGQLKYAHSKYVNYIEGTAQGNSHLWKRVS